MAELHFTDDNFKDEIKEGVVLVDFFATWCGPCKMIAPVIAELATEYEGKAKIGKLDVDESSATAGEFGVQSIPTLILFKDGQEVDRIIGNQTSDAIEEKIKSYL